MSKKGVVTGLAVLTAAYQKEMTDATIRLYVDHLDDIADNVLSKAIDEIIVRNRFFPSIAEIRERSALVVLGDTLPPESAVAWAEVWRAVTSDGRFHKPQWSHPSISLALEECGGYYELCMSTQPERLRSQFIRAFSRMREDTIRNVAVTRWSGDEARKAIEANDASDV